MTLVDKLTIYPNYLSFFTEFNPELTRIVILCGLPGSGKSSLGEMLRDTWHFRYLSSDLARVELMKLTKGKFATTKEYEKFQERVYGYMRQESLKEYRLGEGVVLDATHLNEQRHKLVSYLEKNGVPERDVMLVYVDAGRKENIRTRFERKPGRNADGRSWVEAWETAYDYFVNKIKQGEVTVPSKKEERFPVVWVMNR